jgi:methylated-DNA-protein-cysteine methyltransferase-like protein
LTVANSTYSRIYTVVRRIPTGRVASYGQVARVAGLGGARQVGYALHALPHGSTVPWHRVLNAAGRISLRDHHALTQRLLLEREGVRFDSGGRVDFVKFGWRPAIGRNTRSPKG